MFNLTVTVPTADHGDLSVAAEIEQRPYGRTRYHIGTVRDALGQPVECSLDLLEEIEMSIDFEMQCARYEAHFFETDSPYLASFHA